MPKKEKDKTEFTEEDFPLIAQYITDTWATRKKNRKDEEKIWQEIDRQIAMDPDLSFKKDARSGKEIPSMSWMPEVELPLQAEALEVLTADARRMIFPGNGGWFMAHAETTDEFLANLTANVKIAGDENDVVSAVTQDNVDKLVQGVINHYHRQYDFRGHIDIINAEAFKYGIGIGRLRKVKKGLFGKQGIMGEQEEIPILVPRSIKNIYLDDSKHNLMNAGLMISGGIIFEQTQKVEDLRMAANEGSDDAEDEDGGWIKNAIEIFDGPEVTTLEYEGDLVVPRPDQGSIIQENVIVTIAKGMSDKKTKQSVLRFRSNQKPSYFEFPYHQEHAQKPYPASPLMKGMPIQKVATEAISRTMQAAALAAQGVIRYDPDNPTFGMESGPVIYPGATIPSTGDITSLEFGSPAEMFRIYAGMLQQYSDVTGIHAPRLGAQTVSHTTAHAKNIEIQRGTVRTVDYVASILQGPLTQFLYREYEMIRELIGKQSLYIEEYSHGFVEINGKKSLPKNVTFETPGAGGPAEEAQKQAAKFGALNQAMQVDALQIQTGGQPDLDYSAIKRQILTEGGWADADQFIVGGAGDIPGQTQNGPPVQGGIEGNPAAATVALQAIGGGL